MKLRICSACISAGLIAFGFIVGPPAMAEIENFESVRVIDSSLPEYPVRLAYEGIYQGGARLIVSIDETGKLTDVFIESYSHSEFGRLAERYIHRWSFQPAKLNGEPITSIKPIDFHFDDKRGVYSIGAPEALTALFYTGDTLDSKRIHSVEELDRDLEPIEMAQPLYPEVFKNSDMDGSATIEFYVDEKGHVRVPHTTEYTHGSFGETALVTVKEWKFKPPRVNGKPVSIHVRQTFNFKGMSK